MLIHAVLPHRPTPCKGRKNMNYLEKLDNLDRHIEEHPSDYQAVIARLKTASDAYEHQLYLRKIARLKRVAEIRQKLEGEDNGKES